MTNPTHDPVTDAITELRARVEAIEAFILRRPTEPIPDSIIDRAIEERERAAEEEAEEAPEEGEPSESEEEE